MKRLFFISLIPLERAVEASYCEAPVPSADLNYPPHSLLTSSALNIESVIVVTRHGDRAPCNVMANEDGSVWDTCDLGDRHQLQGGEVHLQARRVREPGPWNQEGVWNDWGSAGVVGWLGTCEPGDLTTKGAAQHYRLGEAVGVRYGMKNTRRVRLDVESTIVPRAKLSAFSFVTGLLSHRQGKEKDDTVVVSTASTANTVLQPQAGKCGRLGELYEEMMTSDPWKNHLDAALQGRLDAVCGTGSLEGWKASYDHFFDNFRGRTCNGMKLPCRVGADGGVSCVSMEDADVVFAGGNWEMNYRYCKNGGFTHVKEKVRLEAGPLLDKIKRKLTTHTKDEDGSITVSMLSGHDDTVGPLLGLIGASTVNWPPYASNIIFEKWSNTERTSHFMRVLYNNEPLSIDGCEGGFCPLDDFVAWLHLEGLVTQDLKKECAPRREFVIGHDKLVHLIKSM